MEKDLIDEVLEDEEVENEERKNNIIKYAVTGLVTTAVTAVVGNVVMKILEPRRKFKKIDKLVNKINENLIKMSEMREELIELIDIYGVTNIELNKLKCPVQLKKDITNSIMDIEDKTTDVLSENNTNDKIIQRLYKILEEQNLRMKALNVRFDYIKTEMKK